MSAHTPGPWIDGPAAWFRGRVSEEDGKRPINSVSNSSAAVIANVYGKANARLIAAAPDLLASATALLAWADMQPVKHPQQAEMRNAARAAIAKATTP